MMPTCRSLAAVLLLLAGCATTAATIDACSADVCQFTGDDAEDCTVVGKLDGQLTAYVRCPQACLDDLNIKREAVDPDTLANMFPNADGSNGSPTAVVNFVRFESGSVVMSVRAGFPEYFQEDPDKAGSVVLRDTVEGTDCTASQSACYTLFKEYLGTAKGGKEMQQVGETLWNDVALSRELEQGLCRIRACQYTDGDDADTDAAATTCETAFTSLAAIRGDNASVYCSAFGMGPAELACSGGTTAGDEAGDSMAGAAAPARLGAVALAALAFAAAVAL